MSVQNISRFVAHLALDYKKLRKYLEGSHTFLPVGNDEKTLKKIEEACGHLDEEELSLIRGGDWEAIFEYIADSGPRPMGSDQGNYP